MAAEIDGTGIVFSDSTRLDSYYDIFAQGTDAIFFQASAPSGWAKNTSHNNKALRVVTGSGGGSGGSILLLVHFHLQNLYLVTSLFLEQLVITL